MRKSQLANGDEPLKPVGIWIRVSTEDQAKGESPEHHEKRARAYAESKGWQVREVYHLEGVSGKAVLEHAETKHMLKHIAAGRITGLIFSKLARLARNTRELLDFADLFREHGADLISLQESIDTSTPAGRLFYTMIAAMAQWEREEIAERVAASVPIRAMLGKPTGGAAPYGYQWKNRQLVVDPQEAPVRRLIYELFAEQRRKKGVARVLNERGYRTRSGSRFTDTTIDRLIRDPLAKGQRRANYTRSRGEKKHWDLKPESEWVYSSVEPVVTEELWERCNAILNDGREKVRRRGRPPKHLFAGLVRCTAGHAMYAFTSWGKYVCRRCHVRIATGDLEAVFQEQLKGFFLDPEQLARYLAQSDEVLKGRDEAIATLRGEETRVRSEMDRVYRAYVSDQLSVEGFGRQYGPLEVRLKQLEEELPRLQGEADFMRIQILSRDDVFAGGKDLAARWGDLDPTEKRQIVESLVEGISVGKDEIAFDLGCFPSAAEIAGKRQRLNTDSSPRSGSRATGSARSPRRARSTPSRSRAARAARRSCCGRTARTRRGTGRRGGRARSRRAAAGCRRRSARDATTTSAARGRDGGA
jgi:site-specific DNA recombinase